MEELTLQAVDGLIKKAAEAFNTKAENAESLAKEAEVKAEEMLKKMDGMLSKEDAGKLEKQLQDLDLLIQKKNADTVVKTESFRESFMKAYEPIQKEILKLKSGNERLRAPLVFEIEQKAVGTISLASTIGNVASSGQVTISEFTGIVSPIRQRLLTYLSNVSVGQIVGQYAVWVEEYDEEGEPIFIGEGVSKTQIDVQYKEQRAKVEKIGVHMKVTMEMLEDASSLFSYIQSNGVKRVETAIESQLFNGSGTSPQLVGLSSKSTAFTGGTTMPLTVDNATNWDVINAIIAQAKEANGIVTGIFVDNGKLHSMLSAKGTDAHYVLPAGVTFDGQGGVRAWGVPLIGTNALAAASLDFIGGDLSVINVQLRSGIQVAIGESGTDFIDNLQTVRIEQRLVQFVSANNVPVLIKGTFTAAKAILETV